MASLKRRIKFGVKINALRESLITQWLGLCAFTAKCGGSIPERGTKISEAAQHGQKKKSHCDLLADSKLGPIFQVLLKRTLASQQET